MSAASCFSVMTSDDIVHHPAPPLSWERIFTPSRGCRREHIGNVRCTTVTVQSGSDQVTDSNRLKYHKTAALLTEAEQTKTCFTLYS